MGLMTGIDIIKSLQMVSFNTGTIYDLLTGTVITSGKGTWHVDGGFPTLISGFCGYPNSFKSTIEAGLILRSLNIYPGAEAIILDTETSLIRDLERLKRFIPRAPISILDRIHGLSGANYNIASFFEFVKDLCLRKEKNKKDYIIETPIVDANTGKLGKAWIPTYVLIDSLTELESTEEKDLIEKDGLDSGKSKTANMADGLRKTQLIRIMRKYCERYGIILICTAQVDQGIDMGGMFSSKPKKQLQHMKVGESFKNTGTSFKRLASTIIQANPAKVLDNNEVKTSYYPDGPTPWKDINEVGITTTRCKSQLSGITTPLVVSQSNGLLNSLTNFHYLKNEKFGVTRSGGNYRIDLSPDINVTRKTIRETANVSGEYRRALQLSAELAFVQKYYNTKTLAMNVDIKPTELYTKLKELGVLNDVMNSRGFWTYDKEEKRPYCSIFDVLTMVTNKEHVKTVFK